MSLARVIVRMRGARVLGTLVAVCLGFMFTLGVGDARAGSCVQAAVVERTVSAFEAAARNGSPRAYTAALSRHASVAGLALFALGPYRREMTGGLKAEYVRLATQYMGRIMADHGHHIFGGKLVIKECFPQNGAILVRSRIGQTHLTWRVQGQRISDVKVEGIWLALTLRQSFVQVLRDHGGNPQALIRYLRKS